MKVLKTKKKKLIYFFSLISISKKEIKSFSLGSFMKGGKNILQFS